MFSIGSKIYNLKEVTFRDLGYGEKINFTTSKKFLWNEILETFVLRCEKQVDEFILQCKIDDKKSLEPDIESLYQINYPLSKILSKNYPKIYCELLLDFPELIFNSYFNVYALKEGFAINQISSIYISKGNIFVEGEGYYFPVKGNYTK